jgi:M6 family metalloprotease-like protein
MRRVLIAIAGLLITTASVHAQDVELRARAGVLLPAAYFARVRAEPDVFEFDRGWITRNQLVAARSGAVTGTLPLVVVQALFSDSPEPSVTSEHVQRVLFDGPMPNGTLTQFYEEVSGGQLQVTGRVLPWVRTAITRTGVVGTSYGLGNDADMGTWLVQALTLSDPAVDFGQFDNDGLDGVPNSGDDDGFVDAVAFQFIEMAASCGGNGIWPHRSRIRSQAGSAYTTNDLRPNGQPVFVDSYIVQSTIDCAGAPMNASVIAHELGHALGLPDLYHQANGILPPQRRWVLGCWSLMAAGSWGCGDGSTHGITQRPTHMGPWEKAQLGWITEEIVGSVRDHEFVLTPVQTSGRSLRIPLGGAEYLQLEYRPRLGFDVDLPASGVLIYHIDTSRPFFPNPAGPRLYRVSMKEADGDSALRRTSVEGGNRGVASDAWATGGTAAFSAITTPSLLRNTGVPSTVTIHSITIANGVARVRVSTNAIPAVVDALPATPALATINAVLRAAGGALPFQWTVTGSLPRGVTATSSADRVTFSGTPTEPGSFPLELRIADALGTVITHAVSFVVSAVQFDRDRVLQHFLRSSATPLTAAEQQYLDNAGNRNGRYDVGDLRRYLRSQP